MLEIIFVSYINIILFKIKIYIHQKISIAIILIIPTLMEISSIISVYNSDEEREFKNHPWIIFIGIIGFLILFFIDAFVLCKTKWYLDLRFISDKKMLIYLGLLGFIIFLITGLICNSIICSNNYFSDLICLVYKDKSEKYFDNFMIFFRNIWRENRTPIINIIYIFIILLKIFFSAFNYLFVYLIIKVLGPEYLICSDSILYFLIKTITLIYRIITNELNSEFIFDFLSQIFSILGTIIYLELIELNFCNLNYNLKSNINKRAEFESFDITNDDKYSQDSQDPERKDTNSCISLEELN